MRIRTVPGLADREDHDDGLGCETARHEAQHLRGGPIEPLGIVDQADERLRCRDLGQQTQDGEPDQETIGRRSALAPERDAQRRALRIGEQIDMVEDRSTELLERGERKLHLRLHPRGSDQTTANGAREQVVEERGLPDTGVAAHDDRPAVPAACPLEQGFKTRRLGTTVDQGSSGGKRGSHQDIDPCGAQRVVRVTIAVPARRERAPAGR